VSLIYIVRPQCAILIVIGTHDRHPSAAPSFSSGFTRRTSKLPSPSPSVVSSVTTPSLDNFPSFTSIDSADFTEVDPAEFEKTPTKPKTRAQVHHAATVFPTPPPSSPFIRADDVDATAERMGLVRMRSDVTVESSSTDVDTETDEPSEGRVLNPYKQLKQHLRLSTAANQTIVGREEEIVALKAYLSDVNSLDVGMYVSGPPGTGKTATVTSLGREMKRNGWNIVEMGCMGMKVADLWRRLGEQLECGRTERDVVAHLQATPTNT